MNISIDTQNKAIEIMGEVSIQELLNFLKEKELTDYKLKGNKDVYVPYISPVNPYTVYPNIPNIPIWVYDPNSQPFYITCNT